MFDLDKWQEIWTTMSRHKLRTALTAFGVFWGIFMLVVLVGSGNGLRNGVMEGFQGIATNSFFMWGQKTTKPYAGMQPGRFVKLTNDDSDAIRREIEEVEYLAPRVRVDGNFKVSRGIKNGAFSVFGDFPDVNKIEPKPMRSGRFINDTDINEYRKVAVIGERVRDVLFGNGTDAIGEYIEVKGVFFQVVGVFGTRARGENANEQLNTIYLPFTTCQRVFNIPNRVYWYSITAKTGVPASVVEEKVKALLKVRHHIAPDDRTAIGSFNLENEFGRIQGLFTGINIFMWIVGMGTLIAGVVGVSNIMLIVVQERTKEIGVRKALGATPWSVISLILQESVTLTTVSGYTGLVCGVIITELINFAMESSGGEGGFLKNPTIDFQMAVAATTVLIFSGALAAVIPATRAASIQPIEALRAD